MIYLIEQWNARPGWWALSMEERGAFAARTAEVMGPVMAQGIRCLAWADNRQDTPHRAPYDYFAVWEMPDHQTAQRFLQAVAEVGWYQHFEQVNLLGQAEAPEAVFGRLVQGKVR